MTATARHAGLGVPGPHPLFGPYAATLSFFQDSIGYTDRLFAQYGAIVGVKTASMATPPSRDYPGTIFLYGPTLIQQVVTQHDTYHRVALSHRLYPTGHISPRQEPLTRIMTGLPHLKKESHRQHRRLMMPAFSKQAVQAYHDDMVAATRSILDTWKVGERRDICRDMLLLTMRISATTLFGRTSVTEGERIGHIVEEWFIFVMSVSHLFAYDLPGVPYRSWLDLSHTIEQATRQMIAEKRASGATDGSLLSILIHARDQDGTRLSEDELIGHMSLLLWGSRDASVYAVTWILFLLSQNPDVAAAVVDELDHSVAGDAPTIQELDELPVLERGIKEGLRILPPFPFNHRVAAEQTVLEGYVVPAGTEIVLSIYHTHRMPDLYPNAATFSPDRWLSITPTLHEFTPFGGGPRMCIGASFAMQELKVILAMVLRRYRLEFIPGTRVDRLVKVALAPKNGLPMIVRKQDRRFRRGVGGVRGNIREMVYLPEIEH